MSSPRITAGTPSRLRALLPFAVAAAGVALAVAVVAADSEGAFLAVEVVFGALLGVWLVSGSGPDGRGSGAGGGR